MTRQRGRRITLSGLLAASGVVAGGATALAYFSASWWCFDLLTHFRAQYLVMLGVAGIASLIRRRYLATAFFTLFGAVNLWLILPLYAKAPAAAVISPSAQMRALWTNVNTEWGVPARVEELIRTEAPDVLVLGEVNERWLAALRSALADYPHSEVMPRDDHFGLALFSKYPFTSSATRYIGNAEVPTVVAEVDAPAGRFTVIGTHPLPPVGPEQTRLRDEQLAQLAPVIAAAQTPVLLLGDLNTTPWCLAFRRLLATSGLRDSSAGRGIQPTWPSFLPLLWIPIDHCLHGPGLVIVSKRVGGRVGSDHYPLVIDFALSPGRR